jgi:inorganic pyrophosphatase/exopolyphosphatase
MDLWKINNIQFARLLTEINGVGLNKRQMKMLRESMDLTNDDIDEIFDRAIIAFEKNKKKYVYPHPASK